MTDTRINDGGRVDGIGKPDTAGRPESGSGGLLKLVLMAAIAVAVAAVALHSLTRYAAEGFGHHEVVRILVQGQSLHVPENELEAFGASLRGYLDEQHARTLAEIDRMIDARVDALFEPAFARVPDYVDWYYSLGASGMRLGTLILRDLEAHIQRSVEQRLLGGEHFGHDLQAVTGELDQALLARQQELKPAIEARLLSRYADGAGAEAPVQELPVARSFDLSSALSESLVADQEDYSRWTRSSGAAMVAAGSVTAGRIVATSAVLRGAVARAGRGLAALAARRAATAAPAAATAGAVAAPTGPGAVVVGAGVFVVSVVGGEYVFLQVDKHARGADFEEELEAALALARDALKDTLRSHYQGVLYQAHGEWLERLDRTFDQDGVAREFRVLGARGGASRPDLQGAGLPAQSVR